MHAWWIRAFRSAYGSASGAGAVAPFQFGTTARAAPFSPWRERRSWSPIVAQLLARLNERRFPFWAGASFRTTAFASSRMAFV